MNRIMKRPMFRKGGSAGEGITSGLAPRQGYQGTGNAADQSVQPFDLSKLENIRDLNPQQLLQLSKQLSLKQPPMQPDRSLGNFKIDFGLDLLSRSPSGNIFQTAGAAAKEPFANFRASRAAYNKGVNDRAINKYNSEADMFSTLLGAQADILGEGGSSYKDLEIAKALEGIMPRFIELRQKREELISNGGALSKEEDLELRQLQEKYNRFSAKNLEDDLLMEIYAKSLGDRAIPKRVNELYTADLANDPRKYTSKDDPQIKKDAVESIRVELQNLRTYADGGRAGYANGELVEEQITETATMDPGAMSSQNMNTDNPISYDQLRARLPAEITDDIVELIANSAEALEDFAMISDQSQVDQFNKKYSVNLVLPAEA
jgi:hypothetical protein